MPGKNDLGAGESQDSGQGEESVTKKYRGPLHGDLSKENTWGVHGSSL